MRVTSQLLAERFLSNLRQIQTRMDKTNLQMTTGRKFQRPEDDPVGAYRSLRISSLLEGVRQYLKNVADASNMLEVAEMYVSQTVQSVHRIRELAVNLNNGTYSDSDRMATLEELREIRGNIIELANANYAGRYIFAGQKTQVKPFTVDPDTGDVVYNGDTNQVLFEIDDGVLIAVNSPGSSVFGQLFKNIDQLIANIESGTRLDDDLAAIDQSLDHLISSQADLGARMKRVEMSRTRLTDVELSLEKLQTENEQIDLAEAIMTYKMDETTLRAALAAGGRLLQPSLVDFLS